MSTCHLTLTPLSTNNLNTKFHCAFSAMTVPISLSLSTPVPILPGKQQCFRLQSQGHQSVQTSVKLHCSCTLLNLRCSTTHVLSHKNVATKPRSLTKQTRSSQVLMPTFLKDVATKPRSPTLQVLMPTFLLPTTISRHDARLSSTTHCALRASRINYNLTNLSRCNSFLLF